MRLDIRNKKDIPIAARMKAIDKKTGQEIPMVIAGDDSTGQLVLYETDGRGNVFIRDGILAVVSIVREFEFVRVAN